MIHDKNKILVAFFYIVENMKRENFVVANGTVVSRIFWVGKKFCTRENYIKSYYYMSIHLQNPFFFLMISVVIFKFSTLETSLFRRRKKKKSDEAISIKSLNLNILSRRLTLQKQRTVRVHSLKTKH